MCITITIIIVIIVIIIIIIIIISVTDWSKGYRGEVASSRLRV
jgi:hypothetical protein